MTSPVVRTAHDVDRAELDRFLRRTYPPSKASFLERHGGWWHRGQQNRWVIAEGREVVAYCAVIPTAMRVAGERVDAAWWVDLVVDPDHRGRGLQRVFDQYVRTAAPLILGFPNALAAAIHRRHGWGVREDLEVRLLPLRPGGVVRRSASGPITKAWLRLAALAAEPMAWVYRRRVERFEPRFSRIVEDPSAGELAEVFHRGEDPRVATTFRDADYLEWRFLDAPYRDEFFVVSGGVGAASDVAAVVRVMHDQRGTVARILDLFGALVETEVVRDVLWLAARHALSLGACQTTAMSASPSISGCLRSVGFAVRRRGRFCWTCSDGSVSSGINASTLHLVLGDSDNDEP